MVVPGACCRRFLYLTSARPLRQIGVRLTIEGRSPSHG